MSRPMEPGQTWRIHLREDAMNYFIYQVRTVRDGFAHGSLMQFDKTHALTGLSMNVTRHARDEDQWQYILLAPTENPVGG